MDGTMTEPQGDGQPTRRGIRANGRGTWGCVFQKPMLRMARQCDTRLPTDQRLFMAVLGRANNSGHAMFDQGELASILGTVDPATGVVKPLHRTTVNSAIGRGIE